MKKNCACKCMACSGIGKHFHSVEIEENKAEIFVRHIEKHLKEMGYPDTAKTMCKICRKDIDKIFNAEKK